MRRRLLEPAVELELYDEEHVRLKVKPREDEAAFELVLEDAAIRELGRRRVTLRFNEAHLFHQESMVERVARELREQSNGIEPTVDEVLEEIRRRRIQP